MTMKKKTPKTKVGRRNFIKLGAAGLVASNLPLNTLAQTSAPSPSPSPTPAPRITKEMMRQAEKLIGIELTDAHAGKAGRTYPLKWRIFAATGDEVTDLAAVASIRHKQVPCGSFTGDPTDALEVTATGGTGLRYEDTFVYNWKTPAGPGCYEVFVTLADGGVHASYFVLK